jgi:hypothetical protein
LLIVAHVLDFTASPARYIFLLEVPRGAKPALVHRRGSVALKGLPLSSTHHRP